LQTFFITKLEPFLLIKEDDVCVYKKCHRKQFASFIDTLFVSKFQSTFFINFSNNFADKIKVIHLSTLIRRSNI